MKRTVEQKMIPAEEVIALADVSVIRDGRTILDQVNWRAHRGEHWVLYGPNGAGKTTLLNVVCGYLWPTEGEVRVLRQKFGSVDLAQLRQRIALVSDPLQRMIRPDLCGVEVLITGARAHLNLFDPPSSAELRHAVEIARETGTEDLLEKPFGAMSTGERQRMLIARALMRKPALLILDEPCAGLDLAGREFLLHTMELIVRRPHPPSLVFTTHHVEEITEIFTHMLLLRAGQILSSGPILKTLSSRHLSDLFEMPIRVVRRHGRWSAFFDRQNGKKP